jgi:hypothetical protein
LLLFLYSLPLQKHVPVFSDDDTGIITNEDDIIVYQGNNSAFNLNEGRQKIKVGQTFEKSNDLEVFENKKTKWPNRDGKKIS